VISFCVDILFLFDTYLAQAGIVLEMNVERSDWEEPGLDELDRESLSCRLK
jgi:hypothetical protein